MFHHSSIGVKLGYFYDVKEVRQGVQLVSKVLLIGMMMLYAVLFFGLVQTLPV